MKSLPATTIVSNHDPSVVGAAMPQPMHGGGSQPYLLVQIVPSLQIGSLAKVEIVKVSKSDRVRSVFLMPEG